MCFDLRRATFEPLGALKVGGVPPAPCKKGPARGLRIARGEGRQEEREKSKYLVKNGLIQVYPTWHGSRMSEGMNLHNALGFALLGLVMKVLPLLFPSLIEAGGPEGTRALWLLVMSWVMWSLTTWGVVTVVLASGVHRVLGVWVFGTEASRLERRREVSAAGARTARVAGGLQT